MTKLHGAEVGTLQFGLLLPDAIVIFQAIACYSKSKCTQCVRKWCLPCRGMPPYASATYVELSQICTVHMLSLHMNLRNHARTKTKECTSLPIRIHVCLKLQACRLPLISLHRPRYTNVPLANAPDHTAAPQAPQLPAQPQHH